MYWAKQNQTKNTFAFKQSLHPPERQWEREITRTSCACASLTSRKTLYQHEGDDCSAQIPPQLSVPWGTGKTLLWFNNHQLWFSFWLCQEFSTQLSLKSKTRMRCLSSPKHGTLVEIIIYDAMSTEQTVAVPKCWAQFTATMGPSMLCDWGCNLCNDVGPRLQRIPLLVSWFNVLLKFE